VRPTLWASGASALTDFFFCCSCYDIALALGSRIAALNVEDATATNKNDEAMIIKLVEENGGMATMNEFLRNNMVTDLQHARHQFNSKVDELDSRLTTCSEANEVQTRAIQF